MQTSHAVVVDNEYAIVGATIDDDAKTIRRAYRRMALRLHPDQNRDDPHANEKFARLVSAFELLSDEKEREKIDQRIHANAEREKKMMALSADRQKQIRKLHEREAAADAARRKRHDATHEDMMKKKTQNELQRFREMLAQQAQASSMKCKPHSSSSSSSSTSVTASSYSLEHVVRVKISSKKRPIPTSHDIRTTLAQFGCVQRVFDDDDVAKKKRRVFVALDSSQTLERVMSASTFLDGMGLTVSRSKPNHSFTNNDGPNNTLSDETLESSSAPAPTFQGASPLHDGTASPSRNMPFDELEKFVLERARRMGDKQRLWRAQQPTQV